VSIEQMIAALDAPGGMPGDPDGIDTRTVREVYDAGLLTDADVEQLYQTHICQWCGLPQHPTRACVAG
jgi:hypothetical protein